VGEIGGDSGRDLEMGRLTKRRVAHEREPGRYGDGDGLWLQVTPTGGKSWLLRYQLNGRARTMGLGRTDLVPLDEARELARAARRLLLDRIDPIDHRRHRFAERHLAGMTFKEAAEALIADREGGWKNATHRGQWKATLKQYAYPLIGNLPVAEVGTAHVLRCLRPIWSSKQVTADRVRARIEAILNWAAAHGRRELGINPAGRDLLRDLLPATAKVKHLAAMPFADVPAFLHVLRKREGVAPKALEFAILTATRTGEVLGAEWDEIDIAGATWTIPGARTKTGNPHRVPLARRAVEILKTLPREGELVFVGARAGRPLNRHTMRETLEAMGVPFTVHGMRSSFRDWASERTGYEHAVCEQALGHALPTGVERAYNRSDLYDKRARLMRDWAAFCGSTATTDTTVVPLNGKRRG
jgi:integrase